MVRISEEKLLKMLEANGRETAVNLAKELNVTETAIRKKMRKLEDEGVIEGYTTLINPKKTGYSVLAAVGIDTKPEAYVALMELLKEKPEVRRAWTASGDHMIMVECWFRETADFQSFIHELEQNEGVTRTCPAIMNERFK